MHDLVYHCAAALYMLLVYADGIAELGLMTLSILTTQPLDICHGVQRGLIVSVKILSSARLSKQPVQELVKSHFC